LVIDLAVVESSVVTLKGGFVDGWMRQSQFWWLTAMHQMTRGNENPEFD
jgi:hypothetical protein